MYVKNMLIFGLVMVSSPNVKFVLNNNKNCAW